MSPMQISSRGLNFITDKEKLRTKAYQDGGGVWTIGWGSTGPDVVEGLVISIGEAERRFRVDLQDKEAAVNSVIKSLTGITQNQYDAMVSLAFNIGATAFKASSVAKLLKKGQVPGAAQAFLLWNKDQDKSGKLVVVAGLTARREAERKLFLS